MTTLNGDWSGVNGSKRASLGGLETHNVVAAIDVDGLAGNAGAAVGKQERGGGADFGGFDVALQRSSLDLRLQHVSKSGDAARSQRLDWSGRDGIHADCFRSEIVSQVANGRFQGGFRYAHDVVPGHDFFRAIVGKRDDSAA